MAGSEKTWVDGTSPTCAADDLNGFKNENNNLIEGVGITLDDTDNQQTHNAVAAYSAGGDFYTGSGSANTYAANPVSPRRGIWALQNGAQIRFVVPATNTGASTINVNSLGAKNLKNWDGSALVGSELVSGEIVTIIYNSGSDEWRLVNRSSLMSLVCPVGTVIPWMDYNGAVSFDSNYWAYMDGSTLSDSDSPLNGEVLTDLSGRYLVGFGTDGGGDIGSALWSVTPVGNAGHTVDLEHSHDSHIHKVSKCIVAGTTTLWRFYKDSYEGANYRSIGHDSNVVLVSGANNGPVAWIDLGGTVNNGDDYVSSAPTASDNQLSTTQSIQPRSIPCRFIIRIK